jgi:aminoglycoside phosphotransferase (APT) family kinase protein
MVPGIDLAALAAWASMEMPDLRPPIECVADHRAPFEHHGPGHRCTGRQLVVHRPPLHSVLASAHDVAPEQRIVRALSSTEVSLPRPSRSARTPTRSGAPFSLVELDGVVLGGRADADALDRTARAEVGRSMIDALVALHAVDPTPWDSEPSPGERATWNANSRGGMPSGT